MLDILFAPPGANAAREPSLVKMRQIEKQRATLEERFKKDPQVKRSLEYFREKIKTVKTVDDLLKDRRLLEFSLSAFQLESQVDMRGFLRKILTEDSSDPKSLASRMNDPRFKQFANAFAFLKNGSDALSDPKIVEAIESAWHVNAFEKKQGEQNPALREAMYFKRMIGGVSNHFQILASPALASVVRTSLNLPMQFSALDVDQQAATLKKHLDLSKVKDPNWVNKFVDRFLINYDLAGGPPQMSSPGLFDLVLQSRSKLNIIV
jgi:hypothetical protein